MKMCYIFRVLGNKRTVLYYELEIFTKRYEIVFYFYKEHFPNKRFTMKRPIDYFYSKNLNNTIYCNIVELTRPDYYLYQGTTIEVTPREQQKIISMVKPHNNIVAEFLKTL